MASTDAEQSAWVGSVLQSPEIVANSLEEGIVAVGKSPRRGEHWVVKLNLTYPTYLPGVVNSPHFIEGLCHWAFERGIRLTLVEGDGGNGSYSAKDAFAGLGVSQIAGKYGVKCLSLSDGQWEWRSTKIAGKVVKLPYSAFFTARDFDRFISAPLFKNHIFTIVTLGMKNLWGCIPDAYRMYYHHLLDHGIVALCKELHPDFSIFDGLIGMRGRGPMEGQPLDLNIIMVSSGIGGGEVAALELMGISIDEVKHLAIARKEGIISNRPINWLTDPGPYCRNDFIIKRTLLNKLTLHISQFPTLQKLIYHSPISSVIYKVVNGIRGDSAQARLLKSKWKGDYTSIALKGNSEKKGQ